MDPKTSSPSRIMILVSRGPFDIPRIKSLAQLCRIIGQTEVIGVTAKADKPTREYDGSLFVERIVIDSSYLLSSKIRIGLFILYRLLKRVLMKPGEMILKQEKKTGALSMLVFSKTVREALYQRIRATSIIPRVIICYGLDALVAGIRMKRLYGCPIIYEDQDSCFREEEVQSYFSNTFKTFMERRFLRFADLVIASSHVMARKLQGRYGNSHILTVADGGFMEEFKRIIEDFCNGESRE